MSAIAGMEGKTDARSMVAGMLDRLAHRGPAGRTVQENEGVCLGACWTAAQDGAAAAGEGRVRDWVGGSHYAEARLLDGRLVLRRDPLGVVPLYFGKTPEGHLCFASEVKALLPLTRHVFELPPGCEYINGAVVRYFELAPGAVVHDPPRDIAATLRRKLDAVIRDRIRGDVFGSWLSGGLDSSAMAALARPYVKTLHTFSIGLPGALDLEYAASVAAFIGAEHHARVVSFGDMLAAIPAAIRSLESFDAWLVRSSVMNHLVGREAAQFVGGVFSGEGGDELFAGYEYLKTIAAIDLKAELLDITGRLHNTALQRVDRCSQAHGLLAHVCFLEQDIVDYSLSIPTDHKLHYGIEKWILREAVRDLLPGPVLERPKAKFWEGAGVQNLIQEHADAEITDADFNRESVLPNGWRLNNKEELLYYRIFREQVGDIENLDWMGRSKGARPPSGTFRE